MKLFQGWRLCAFVFAFPLALMLNSAALLEAVAAETPAHLLAASEPATGNQSQVPAAPKGVLDKLLTIKGADIQVQFGGFVKVDFMYDLDPIGNADQF